MNATVTETIKQDLKNLLTNYASLPFKLTLSGIAKYYSVSLTPIRQVIDELIEDNLLVRKSNGRLERLVKPNSENSSETPPIFDRALTHTMNLDEEIASDIMMLCLDKFDGYLREEATAKKYKTGRTIIRQVFSRLAGVGLIEHVPRCGWKVKPFREKDMIDYLEIREILEVKALRLSRNYLDINDLKKMLEHNFVSSDKTVAEFDSELHHYWINRCDNAYIQDFFERNGPFYSALFDYASLDEEIKPEMAQEHVDILEALIAQDWETAELALIKHIRDQQANVKQLMESLS